MLKFSVCSDLIRPLFFAGSKLALPMLFVWGAAFVQAAAIQLTSSSQESAAAARFVDPDQAGTVYGNTVTFVGASNAVVFSRAAGGAFETDVAGVDYGASGFANGTKVVSGGGFQGPGNGDPITIFFGIPVVQFGINVEEFNPGNYYVQFTAYSGNTSLGTVQAAGANDPNALSFEGLTITGTTPAITSVVFDDVSSVGSATNANNGSNNLVFGNLAYVDAGAVTSPPPAAPEPASFALAGFGVLCLVFCVVFNGRPESLSHWLSGLSFHLGRRAHSGKQTTMKLRIIAFMLTSLGLTAQSLVSQIFTRGFTSDLLSAQDRFVAADLNGDGKTDMIYYRPGGGYAGAYLSHGDGTFRYIPYTNASVGESGFPGDLNSTADTFVALDLNGDGKSDFIEYRPGSGYAMECFSKGDGTVNCVNLSSPGSQSYGFQDNMLSGDEKIVATDINRDGRQDFIVYSARNHTARAYLSPASGYQLTPIVLVKQGIPNSSIGFRDSLLDQNVTIVSLDLNGDGASDLLVLESDSSASSASFSAYFNNGAGIFTWIPYTQGSTVYNGFNGNASNTNARIVPLDLNGDGKADFLFIESGAGTVRAFISSGYGSVTPVNYLVNGTQSNGFTSPDPSTADTAVALDLNGDGKSDFIWYSPGNGEMSAYLASPTGNGSVTRTIYYSGGVAQNGFSDATSDPADTVLALNFLGQTASGFVWYSPGNGLFQAYSPLDGVGDVQFYGFNAWPESFLGDLYWSLANVPLKAINMPGTHDSVMYNLNLGEGDDSETQLSDFTGQLNAGARAFDFRFGYYLIESGAVWRIDGKGDLGGQFPTICDTGAITSEGFYMYGHTDICTNRGVLDELNTIETWLQQHPAEVVILVLDAAVENYGFVYTVGQPWPTDVRPQFIQLLQQTVDPTLIYTQQAACGKLDSVPNVQCSLMSNLPQNMTLAKLRALNKRLILLDEYDLTNYSGYSWSTANTEQGTGFCNDSGETQPYDELTCLDTGENGGIAALRPSFQPAFQASRFFGATADLTPFGAGGGAESPIVFAYGDPFIQPSPFNPFLASEIEGGHWATNALNLWWIDALGVGTFNLAGIPTSYGPLVNDMIALNNQTFLPAGQFTAAVVGAGRNGDVWAVPASHAVAIFKLNPANNVWTPLIFGRSDVKKLVVDSTGGVYVLNTSGAILYYDRNGKGPGFVVGNGGIITAMSDIALAPDDSLWGLASGSGALLEINAKKTPVNIPPTAGVRVAVDNQGNPWVLQSDGTIINVLKGALSNGKAKEIAISADGSMFVVGEEQSGSLYRYNPTNGTFTPLHVDAKQVVTDGGGHPWVISNSSSFVYRGALDQ